MDIELELRKQIENGRQAEVQLQTYKALMDRVSFLTTSLENMGSYTLGTLVIEKSPRDSVRLDVTDKERANQLLRPWIEHELTLAKEELAKFVKVFA